MDYEVGKRVKLIISRKPLEGKNAPRKGLVGTIIAVEDENSFLVQFEGFATGHGFNCDCWYVGQDSVDLLP